VIAVGLTADGVGGARGETGGAGGVGVFLVVVVMVMVILIMGGGRGDEGEAGCSWDIDSRSGDNGSRGRTRTFAVPETWLSIHVIVPRGWDARTYQ
jgi:hypothetical protein